MKRLIAPFLLLAFALAACGSDGTTVSVGADPDDTSTDDTTTDDASTDDTSTDEPTETTEPADADDDTDLPIGGGSYPIATFTVTITHPDAEDVTYEISCLGDTATVIGDVDVSEIAACTALGTDDVRARLIDGPPADQVCTEQYGGPDVARIVGTYDGVDGTPVDASIDRANGCGISDWDVLLAGVLPPAKGL